MSDDNFSIKEVMEAQFKEVHNHLDKIETQTLKTNGRVSKLEQDRAKIWGAIGAVVFLSGTLLFLLKFWVEQSVKTWARESVAQEFDNRFNNIQIDD